MSWNWGQRKQTKRIYRRPRWNREKNKRLPRAFSARAQWGFSNAATERRAEKLQGFADTFNGLLAFFGNLFQRATPDFRPDPPSKQYRIEVK